MSELGIRQSIYEQGYAPIDIDLSKADLTEAMGRYLAYLTLDEGIHESTRFFSTERGDGDFGQFTRVAGAIGLRGAMSDNKDIFHFGSQTRQVVESRIRGRLPHEAKEFLDAAEEIFWASERVKIRALDQLAPEYIDITSPPQSTNNDVLRFIAYYPNEGELAKGHFDRGTCTIAIGESHEGLEIAKGQNGLRINCDEEYMNQLEANLTPVTHREGEAKFFLGAGWNRLPVETIGKRNETLPLGYHAVKNYGLEIDENLMRWAIVRFCNPCVEYPNYTVPTPPETRPYKQLGRLV